jgi:hypothetical protein
MQVSIKIRVKTTSETLMSDATRFLAPSSSHLLRFNFVCCAEKVSNLTNRPVVSLLGTRVDCTSISGSSWKGLCYFISWICEQTPTIRNVHPLLIDLENYVTTYRTTRDTYIRIKKKAKLLIKGILFPGRLNF